MNKSLVKVNSCRHENVIFAGGKVYFSSPGFISFLIHSKTASFIICLCCGQAGKSKAESKKPGKRKNDFYGQKPSVLKKSFEGRTERERERERGRER